MQHTKKFAFFVLWFGLIVFVVLVYYFVVFGFECKAGRRLRRQGLATTPRRRLPGREHGRYKRTVVVCSIATLESVGTVVLAIHV